MNYDEEIQKIVIDVKADKAILQPWRNKSVARLEEAQAFIRYGKTVTPAAKVENEGTRFPMPTAAQCICPFPGRDKSCPIHGNGV